MEEALKYHFTEKPKYKSGRCLHRPHLRHRGGGGSAGRGDRRDRRQRPAGGARHRPDADTIADVNQGASATGSASAQVLTAAKSLATESGQLKTEVARFLDAVRAA
jgi:hypothetical protein